jgi:hypothetical protein
VSATTPKKLLAALLLRKSNRSRLWMAWLSLCAGTALLLLSVMIWWNFRELLYGKKDNDSLGSSFLTVSKKVTDAKMGRPELTQFTPADLDTLSKAPGVMDVGALTSNRFPANITLNSSLGFSTQAFLESVPDRFMDKRPPEWNWHPGTRDVPIILSSEFLNLYNYGFALSQGLPQLSESSIQSLAFDLTLGSIDIRETYSGHVVGFSDRITSVLVPQSFMEFANSKYGKGTPPVPSRLIVKVTDPSDKAFSKFLETHDYITNSEQLRWSKIRAVVEVIAGSTGFLALILMAISGLVFVLFIELTIARAQQSLILLLQLGYSPHYLTRFMMMRFLPLMLGAIIVALVLAVIAQLLASVFITSMNLNLSTFPGWPVWLTALISISLLVLQVRIAIAKAVKQIV